MKTSMFPLLVVVVSLAIPAGSRRTAHDGAVGAGRQAGHSTRTDELPLPGSPEIVEQGQALYNGKGACFNCHGKDGGRQWAAGRLAESVPSQFPARWILASSYGRRNLLGDQERIGRWTTA